MKKALIMFVLCVGLTDAQYRTEVVKIVATNLSDDEKSTTRYQVNYWMAEKILNYRDANVVSDGDNPDIASKCFAGDLYQDITGKPPTAHAIRHMINDMYPGKAFTQ